MFFKTTVSGPFFRLFKADAKSAIQTFKDHKKVMKQNTRQPKNINFHRFFFKKKVCDGLPKPDKKRRQNFDHQKKGQKIVKRKETKNIDFYNVFRARHR